MSTGNESHESFEVEGSELPNLRHKDGTPTPFKAPGTGKRSAIKMSPVLENDFSDTIKKTVDDAIKEAMKNATSQLVASVKEEIKQYFKL